MPAPPAPDGSGADDGDGVSRRTLVRLLVGGAIGVPLLVEALTFLGLVGSRLGDGQPGGTDTTAPAGRRVGVGDEVLPATAPADTVETMYVTEDDWTFTMVVSVENGSDRTYDLRLGAATTEGGERVDGGGESGRVPPGESASVTGRWKLPPGSTPETVDVGATLRNGTVTEVDEQVRLGKVTVRG